MTLSEWVFLLEEMTHNSKDSEEANKLHNIASTKSSFSLSVSARAS